MSTSGTTLSDQDIVARCDLGALVLDIDRWDLNKENLASVLNRSIALHNGGRIDLLGLIDMLIVAAIGGHAFFVLQHFFCEAIPQLEAQSDHLMRAVKALVEKGGNDGAAEGSPMGRFGLGVPRTQLVPDWSLSKRTTEIRSPYAIWHSR